MNARLVTARSLRLDCVAAEVSSDLAAADVPSVLLKGAAIATWLYDDGVARPYGDADLLVSPADFARAESVLSDLGFTLRRPGLSTLEETAHGRVWVRGTDTVDLHRSLWGVGREPMAAWDRLTGDTETLQVGGGYVEVLPLPGRVLHVALHAAQHGGEEPKPCQDLARAGSQVPIETWRRAAGLACELNAEGAMAAGMRMHPETALLADRLGLPDTAPLGVRLHAGTAPLCAAGLARVFATRGLKAKGAMAVRRLVPSPARVRARYPAAARGPGALAVAYARRTMTLAREAPAALVAVRRAGRPDPATARRRPDVDEEPTRA